jgi:hypothetical protein
MTQAARWRSSQEPVPLVLEEAIPEVLLRDALQVGLITTLPRPWGSRGRRFKSCQPDKRPVICGSAGHRFFWVEITHRKPTVLRFVLTPGAALPALRDDLTAQMPCLDVNGDAWWWNDAADQVAGKDSSSTSGSGLSQTGAVPPRHTGR